MHEPYFSRFMRRIDNAGDCWLWTAGATKAGYGQAYVPHKVTAHRAAYEHFVGPIPDGAEIAHSCNVKRCVNPAHLRPASHAENMLDLKRAGTHRGCPGNTWNRGSRSPRTRLTEDDVAKILADPRVFREIAEDYGVAISTIKGIRQRKKWVHVPTPDGYVLRSIGRPRQTMQ